MLVWAIISRFATMLGFLACADLLGIRSLRERLIFVTLISFSSILFLQSSGSYGGLLVNYFTHSQFANATLLLTVWLTARRHYTAAMAMNGATFFLNAFMAVWAFAPRAAIAVMQWRRGEAGWRNIAMRSALGVPIFLLLAVPAIRGVLANPDNGRPINFDYVHFLEQYAPGHFLIWTLSIGTIVTLGGITATGLAGGMATRSRRQERGLLPRDTGRILPALAVRCDPAVSHPRARAAEPAPASIERRDPSVRCDGARGTFYEVADGAGCAPPLLGTAHGHWRLAGPAPSAGIPRRRASGREARVGRSVLAARPPCNADPDGRLAHPDISQREGEQDRAGARRRVERACGLGEGEQPATRHLHGSTQ